MIFLYVLLNEPRIQLPRLNFWATKKRSHYREDTPMKSISGKNYFTENCSDIFQTPRGSTRDHQLFYI